MDMHWQTALAETIGEFADQPMQWGSVDCCTFVQRYLDKLGYHVKLPAYDSERSALRLIHAHGWERMADDRLRRADTPMPGDVVLAKHGGLTFPAVWNGDYCWLFHHDGGPARVDAENVLGVWSWR